MRSETLITLSQNELDAFTVIGNIDCKGVICSKCPLALNVDSNGFVAVCMRDRANAIVNTIKSNGRMTIR